MDLSRTTAYCLLFGILAGPYVQGQQGLNNLWTGGLASYAGPPFGGLDIDFLSGTPVLTYVDRDIDYRLTVANITDSAGNLLFSSNGAHLADRFGDTLFNGSGINPSSYTSSYPNGMFLPQSQLILPVPSTPNIYYLIHGTFDDQVNGTATKLYRSVIDMTLNGGLGGVTTKNEVLIEDALNVGKITAVRHANGRDWWVFCHKESTAIYYRLLVTPWGVSVEGTQEIGIVRTRDLGQVCFSPDGSKFAYYWSVDDLEIFDFDRCTGLFSNPRFIPIDDDNFNSGVAFSPNGRYVYVSSSSDAYQFDTQASDVASSMVHIAEWDGFYSPEPPFATVFDMSQLAPDGKVYMSTGNSTFHLHVVNNPDEGGFACNMVQHGVELPTWFDNSLPNHPNYHLGPVDGSVCDSLGITTGIPPEQLQAATRATPNPTTGTIALSYPAQATAGVLEVLDVQGRVVYTQRLPQWSTIHQVQLEQVHGGMYHCRLQWGGQRATVRVIVTAP